MIFWYCVRGDSAGHSGVNFVNCGFFCIMIRSLDKATVVEFQLKTCRRGTPSVGWLLYSYTGEHSVKENSKGTASSQFCSQAGGNDFTGFYDHIYWTKPRTKHEQRLHDKEVRETILLPSVLKELPEQMKTVMQAVSRLECAQTAQHKCRLDWKK